MKATVKIKSNAYAACNGRTFKVNELMFNGNKPLVALEVPNRFLQKPETLSGITTTVDFTIDEITIVDLDEEMNFWKKSNSDMIDRLKKYCYYKNIMV